MKQEIENFVNELEPAKQKAVQALRSVIYHVDNRIEERLSGQVLLYSYEGDIIMIHDQPNEEYVNVEFFNGSKLYDPDNILIGSEVEPRYIKIYKKADIDVAQIERWIIESVDINENG